jgi:multiple sugar transport system permease protein
MLISKLGRKNFSARLAFAAVYLLLVVGSAIILYPFLLILTSSMATIEYDRFYPLPVFLWDDSVLLGKYLHEKYVGPSSSIANLAARYGVPIHSVADLKNAMLEGDLLRDFYKGMKPNDPAWRAATTNRVQDWLDFKRLLPVELSGAYFCNESPASTSKVKAGFFEFLRQKYAGHIRRRYENDLRSFNAETGLRINSFDDLEKRDAIIADEVSRVYHVHLSSLRDLRIPEESLESHTWLPPDSPRMNDWLDYKRTLPPEHIQALSLSLFYQDFLARKYSLSLFNSLYGRQHSSFREVVFRSERLATAGEISDWGDFPRTAEDLSTVILVVNSATQLLYEGMLQEQFGTIAEYNRRFATEYKAFFEVLLSPRLPGEPDKAPLWENFVREVAPRHLVVPLPDASYHRELLRSTYISDLERKYFTIQNLNRERKTSFRTFREAYDRKKAAQLLLRNLIEQYGSLEQYNAANRSEWKSWDDVVLPNPIRRAWQQFLSEKYGELPLLNAAHERDYPSFRDIPLPLVLPDHDIVEFVKTALPLRLIALQDTEEARGLWHTHLRNSFGGSVEKLSAALGQPYVAFEEIPFYYALPRNKQIRPFWIEFVEKIVPFELIRFQNPEDNFRNYLREKYLTVQQLNRQHGTTYPSFDAIRPPYREADLLEFYDRKGAIRIGFLLRNFAAVLRSITVRGRALFNTAVLCALSVVGVLLVNPLAAYALSRFRPRVGHRLHFLLLVTAAFPALLTVIPNFLLLKSLRLLNTYWAVVLPTFASGFGILILKSFFDRLPAELFDAARLDGAGEARTFAHVCLPLSGPILAAVALHAFLVTYGMFLWPLLTCQKDKMWPLMVWLYQFHTRDAAAFPELGMASLLVTAIPLVLLFILCQRTVTRGISLPHLR